MLSFKASQVGVMSNSPIKACEELLVQVVYIAEKLTW